LTHIAAVSEDSKKPSSSSYKKRKVKARATGEQKASERAGTECHIDSFFFVGADPTNPFGPLATSNTTEQT
jgi:hypothetical protein